MTARHVIGVVVAVATTVGVAALSQLPYEADRADNAIVRLAWRVRANRFEECRTLSAEELAELPAHMRRSEVCQGRAMPYRLVATIGGDTVVAELVRSAGAREDRPLYVSHTIPLTPGQHRVAVSFERQGQLPDSIPELTPALLTFDEVLELSNKQIALITYDSDQRRLVLLGYGQ